MLLRILLALAALCGLVSAVDLKQYKDHQCSGTWARCTNIPPRVCCRARSFRSRSGSCQKCNSGHKHGVWMRSADATQSCYSLVTTHKGGNNNCIQHYYTFTDGHMWIYDHPGRRSVDDEWGPTEERECHEPDTYSIDGRVFQIDNTTSRELADELQELFARDARAGIPGHFAALEITGTPEAEDEDEEWE